MKKKFYKMLKVTPKGSRSVEWWHQPRFFAEQFVFEGKATKITFQALYHYDTTEMNGYRKNHLGTELFHAPCSQRKWLPDPDSTIYGNVWIVIGTSFKPCFKISDRIRRGMDYASYRAEVKTMGDLHAPSGWFESDGYFFAHDPNELFAAKLALGWSARPASGHVSARHRATGERTTVVSARQGWYRLQPHRYSGPTARERVSALLHILDTEQAAA
jgi:hypothetical protein